MTATHETRPDTAHAVADYAACQAAYAARLAGSDVATCSRVYADTYAAHLPVVTVDPTVTRVQAFMARLRG